MRSDRTRTLLEMALAVALAAVLNALKVWQMPQGGSVSLGMLPIIVLALRRGVLVGVVTGAVYGFVDFFVNPYPPVHWIQLLLDYPLAYASAGLAGIGASAWRRAVSAGRTARAGLTIVTPSVLVGAGARYAVHVVSGVVYFASFAGGQPVLLYSCLYNSYVLISALACAVAAAVIMPSLERAVPSAPAAVAR